MQSQASAHGRFVWFELMTTDVAKAIEFYGKVVGWETEVFGPPGPDAYQMWKIPGGKTIGGVMTLPQAARDMGAPSHWVGNLCVPSTDVAVDKLKAHGGTVYHGPFDVPTIGRVAVVGDPDGATLAFYQPEGEAPGHAGMPQHGEISWVELATANPDKAWAFYTDVAGWTETGSMDMGPMGTYRMFGPSAESSIGGMMKKPDMMPVSAWTFYIYLADLDGAIATAKENGGQLIHGPHEIPGGDRVAVLVDPTGSVFALHGR